MTRPVRPFRLYEVTTRYSDGLAFTETVAAPSRSAARYRRYLDASDAIPDLTFGRFLAMTTARASSRPSDPEAYAYLRRAYGLDVRHGQRVTIRNEGADLEGREGTVVHPNGSRHYVHAVLDGEDGVSLFHPLSVGVLAADGSAGSAWP